jgi:hypothetical protein
MKDINLQVNSEYGYPLRIRVIGPDNQTGTKFPMIFRINGGWSSETNFLDFPEMRQAVVNNNVLIASFYSPMRDEKLHPVGSPELDYKGFKDQNDVATVLRKLFTLPSINLNKIGIWTDSSGCILASGALGRYEDINQQISFYLDWEGPSNIDKILEDIDPNHPAKQKWMQAINAKVGEGKDYTNVKDFYAERKAINFIGQFQGIYQRLQQEIDHALDHYYDHAIAALNTATNGNAQKCQLNKEIPNQIYKSDDYPDGIDISTVVAGVLNLNHWRSRLKIALNIMRSC